MHELQAISAFMSSIMRWRNGLTVTVLPIPDWKQCTLMHGQADCFD
jgi:hypothetical protein